MTRAWGGWKPPGEGRWATPQAAQRRHGRHRTPFPVAMGDAGTESSPVEQMERMDGEGWNLAGFGWGLE
jgi:hypothetical protein